MDSNSQKFYTRETVQGRSIEDPWSVGTTYIIAEAEQLGITWREIPGTRIFELTYKGRNAYFRRRIPFSTTDVGYYGCLDKNVTRLLLQDKGIQIPRGFVLRKSDNQDYWIEVFNALSKPLVIKPTHASHGDGVYLNVLTLEDFIQSVKKAFTTRDYPDAGVLVEETMGGKECRILATREKVIAIMHRVPANVVGNGLNTIKQLIEIKNLDPMREDIDDALYRQIRVDDDLLRNITSQDLTLESVPKKDEVIYLRQVSNLSQGGDGIDITDEVHESVKEVALKVINAIPGLSFAGIDFMTKDYLSTQTNDMYSVIEVNNSPELAIHDKPLIGGKNRHAAREFLRLHFPELAAI